MAELPSEQENELQALRDQLATLTHEQAQAEDRITGIALERDRLKEHVEQCGSCFALVEQQRRAEQAEATHDALRAALRELAEAFRLLGRAAPLDADATFRTCADELDTLLSVPRGIEETTTTGLPVSHSAESENEPPELDGQR